MAALAKDTNRRVERFRGGQFRVKNTSVIYAGGIVACISGDAKASAGASGEIIVGLFNSTAFFGSVTPPANSTGGVTGDTSAATPPAVPVSFEPFVMEHVSVTGVTARSDLFAAVYINATDNPGADLTLTRPAARGGAQCVGFICGYNTTTDVDVCFFGAEKLIGDVGKRETICLGSLNCILSDAADVFGVKATPSGFTMSFHGKVISTFAIVDTVPVGSGGTAIMQPAIAGTSITGGAVTVATATSTPIGLRLAGTTVSAANEFHEGDAISIAAETVTAMTAGRVNFYAVVERLPGA